MHFAGTYREECNFYHTSVLDKSCYTRDYSKPRSVFIWGDSHAQQLNYGLTKELPVGWQVLQVASSSCRASLSSDKMQYCSDSNEFALSTISAVKPDIVIIAQNGGHLSQESDRLVLKLRSLGVGHVLFVGPVPQWTNFLPRLIARNAPQGGPRSQVGLNTDIAPINTQYAKKVSTVPGATYIDVYDLFCDSDGCLTRLGPDSVQDITTLDYGHLMPIASDYLAKNLLVPEILKLASFDATQLK